MRPFTAGTLSLSRQLKLGMLLGDEAELSEAEQQRQLMTFAWMQSQPLDEVFAAVNAGKVDEAVQRFEFDVPVPWIPLIIAEIKRIAEQASAASVEVMQKPNSGDKDAPGNS